MGEGDVFSVNDAFTSKLYKVKIGMVSAQVGGYSCAGLLRIYCTPVFCQSHMMHSLD